MTSLCFFHYLNIVLLFLLIRPLQIFTLFPYTTLFRSLVEDVKGGFAGTDYDTVVDHRPVTIEKDGKTYKLVSAGNYTIGKVDDQGHLTTSDAPIGKIAVGKKTVTYVYEELKQGNVVVNYVDEAGNPIKKSIEDTSDSNIDTLYDTTDHKPKIIGKDGKLYLFSKVKE